MNAPEPLSLEMSRFIRAPRERVYDAFTTRDALAAWMCPRGMRLAEVAADAREGGRYRIVMQARDGTTFIVGGVYRELARPERLVFTWRWENETMPGGETLITVTFAAREGGTDLLLRHTGFPDAGLRDSHGHGWRSTFNRLVELLDERGSAATLTLLGVAESSYVWTARIGLAEKGVRYTHEPAAPHTPAVDAVHPFGRIPALRDGEIEVFETSAILRYVEECFEGPSLLPGSIRERVACEQWVSAANGYLYDPIIRRCVLQHLFPTGADGKIDRGTIDAALAEIPALLAALDRAYGGRDYLVGAAPCLADYFVAPMLAWLDTVPEGPALLRAVPSVRRAMRAMAARESFRTTDPRRA